MMNSRREEGLCTQSQIKPSAEGLMRMSTSAADLSVPVVKWDHSLGRIDYDGDDISESKTKSSQYQQPQQSEGKTAREEKGLKIEDRLLQYS